MGALPPRAASRILLVEPHRLFAEAMRTTLASDPRIEVIGVAFDADEAVRLTKDLSPDVVLVDAEIDGADAVRRLSAANPDTHVVALVTADSTDESTLAEQGAVGFIRKDRSAAELVGTIVEVSSLVLALSGTGSLVTR